MIIKYITAFFCTLSVTSLAAFANPVNKNCPVSDKAVDEEKVIKVPVAFCCEKCKTKFDRDPISFAGKIANITEGKCPVSGKGVDKEHTSVLNVGTCCGKCVAKVKDEPKKYIGKLKAD